MALHASFVGRINVNIHPELPTVGRGVDDATHHAGRAGDGLGEER